MLTKNVDDQVMRDRQTWFWRRVTLQGCLVSLIAILTHSSLVTASLQNDWPTVALQLGLIAAIIWLVTIYFAAVNDASKITSFVGAVGDAVGDARGVSNTSAGG